MSKFDNFPEGRDYRDQPDPGGNYNGGGASGTAAVRSMPVVVDLATFRQFYASRFNIAQNLDGLGYDFDPIVLNQAAPGAVGPMQECSHNWNAMDVGFQLSQHIRYADVAPSMKFPLRGRNGVGGRGYGIGRGRLSQVFTVSLIEPNWIFCKVENSTVQSLDVQLLWGDTSEEVQGSIGNPTQFSIICSP